MQLVFESSCLTWSEQQVLILFNGEENPCSGNTEEGRVEGTPLRTAPSRGHWIMPSRGPGLAWMQLLLQRHVLVGQKLSVAVTCECCLQLSVALRKHSWSSQFHVPPLHIRQAGRPSQVPVAPLGCEGADALMSFWFCSRDGVAAKWKDLQNVLSGPCVGVHSETYGEGSGTLLVHSSCMRLSLLARLAGICLPVPRLLAGMERGRTAFTL